MELDDEYITIRGISKSDLNIKKSRFIGISKSIATEQEAFAFLQDVMSHYSGANHYCYAYSIGYGSKKIFRGNDAGEPINSAGKPILNAIESSELRNVICIVVRYFGGIKLGIGGLIRAYGQTARDCLNNAEKITCMELSELNIEVPNKFIGSITSLVTKLKGKVLNINHGEKALVIINIRNSLIPAFKDQVRSISSDILVD